MIQLKSKHLVSCSLQPAIFSHPLRTCLAFVVCLLGLAACKTTPDADPDLKQQTKELFPESGGAANEDAGEATSELSAKWTIKLLHLKGSPQEPAIQAVLRSVKANGVPEAFLESRGENTLIVVGKYDAPGSADAQAMLKRVKEIQIDGQRPYMAAHMLPPPAQSLKGTIPEWDLRNVRAKYGKQAEFTLQINIYTNPGGRATAAQLKEFRKAAEDAVGTLRKEGANAFYYHDQAGSTVTVGLFSQDDLDSGFSLKPGAGSGVRELQKKFPYAMVNGAGVRDRSVDTQGKPVESMRPSFIVRVPD
jgi:hypothetical protein